MVACQERVFGGDFDRAIVLSANADWWGTWVASMGGRVGLSVCLSLSLFAFAADAQQQMIGAPPEASNMKLVGYNDLQARSAYQPTIHHQGNSWIAYIGHHGGTDNVPAPVNPLTGNAEPNGRIDCSKEMSSSYGVPCTRFPAPGSPASGHTGRPLRGRHQTSLKSVPRCYHDHTLPLHQRRRSPDVTRRGVAYYSRNSLPWRWNSKVEVC